MPSRHVERGTARDVAGAGGRQPPKGGKGRELSSAPKTNTRRTWRPTASGRRMVRADCMTAGGWQLGARRGGGAGWRARLGVECGSAGRFCLPFRRRRNKIKSLPASLPSLRPLFPTPHSLLMSASMLRSGPVRAVSGWKAGRRGRRFFVDWGAPHPDVAPLCSLSGRHRPAPPPTASPFWRHGTELLSRAQGGVTARRGVGWRRHDNLTRCSRLLPPFRTGPPRPRLRRRQRGGPPQLAPWGGARGGGGGRNSAHVNPNLYLSFPPSSSRPPTSTAPCPATTGECERIESKQMYSASRRATTRSRARRGAPKRLRGRTDRPLHPFLPQI